MAMVTMVKVILVWVSMRRASLHSLGLYNLAPNLYEDLHSGNTKRNIISEFLGGDRCHFFTEFLCWCPPRGFGIVGGLEEIGPIKDFSFDLRLRLLRLFFFLFFKNYSRDGFTPESLISLGILLYLG